MIHPWTLAGPKSQIPNPRPVGPGGSHKHSGGTHSLSGYLGALHCKASGSTSRFDVLTEAKDGFDRSCLVNSTRARARAHTHTHTHTYAREHTCASIVIGKSIDRVIFRAPTSITSGPFARTVALARSATFMQRNAFSAPRIGPGSSCKEYRCQKTKQG